MKTLAGFGSRVVRLGTFWFVVATNLDAGVYQSQWLDRAERYWAGPEFWTNPLQDWRVRSGRLECWRSGGDRNAYLLTHELRSGRGSLTTTVTVGRLDSDVASDGTGWVGFKVGSQGEFRDYRDSAVRGYGLNAGMRTNGRLFIGNFTDNAEAVKQALEQVTLRLQVEPLGQRYEVSITALDRNQQVLVVGGFGREQHLLFAEVGHRVTETGVRVCYACSRVDVFQRQHGARPLVLACI